MVIESKQAAETRKRRGLFLKDAHKIVPNMKFKDIKFAHHVGGIRPQLTHKDKRQLIMSEDAE